MTSASVLIPWRADHGWRQRIFDHLLPLWQASPFEIVVGEDDSSGPFNLPRAVNSAVVKASGEYLIKYDADCLPNLERLASLDMTLPWSIVFADSRHLDQVATEQVLDGADPDSVPAAMALPYYCGVFGAHRDVWATAQGMDEDFSGWGCEDIAQFRRFIAASGYPGGIPAGTVTHLWHPEASRDQFEANHRLLRERYNQE